MKEILMQFPKKQPILIDFDKYCSCLGMLKSLPVLTTWWSESRQQISSHHLKRGFKTWWVLMQKLDGYEGFGSSWTLNVASYHFTGPLAAQACDPENLWGRACGRAAGTQKFVGTFPCNRCFFAQRKAKTLLILMIILKRDFR
jgi:hypothetical protein